MSNLIELDFSSTLRELAGLFPMMLMFDSTVDEGEEFVRFHFTFFKPQLIVHSVNILISSARS